MHILLFYLSSSPTGGKMCELLCLCISINFAIINNNNLKNALKNTLNNFVHEFLRKSSESKGYPKFDPIGVYNEFNHQRIHHIDILNRLVKETRSYLRIDESWE